MKPQDQYLKFVRWEEDGQLYVGYCPDLFPWGGVCHAKTEEEAFRTLRQLVREEVYDLIAAGKPLPTPSARVSTSGETERESYPGPNGANARQTRHWQAVSNMKIRSRSRSQPSDRFSTPKLVLGKEITLGDELIDLDNHAVTNRPDEILVPAEPDQNSIDPGFERDLNGITQGL